MSKDETVHTTDSVALTHAEQQRRNRIKMWRAEILDPTRDEELTPLAPLLDAYAADLIAEAANEVYKAMEADTLGGCDLPTMKVFRAHLKQRSRDDQTTDNNNINIKERNEMATKTTTELLDHFEKFADNWNRDWIAGHDPAHWTDCADELRAEVRRLRESGAGSMGQVVRAIYDSTSRAAAELLADLFDPNKRDGK